MAISLNLYVLFGLLEVLIILVVFGTVAGFQWRTAQRKAETLRKELHKAKSEVRKDVVKLSAESTEPSRGYPDFLREQLDQSSILLGGDPQIQSDQDSEDPATVTRQMLAARHQFLQLELDVQGLSAERDVEAQRKSVVDGMQALLAGLLVHPDTAETQPETDEVVADDTGDAPVSKNLSEEEKLRGQVKFLRNVVSNQHDVMHELRQLLEEHGGDSDELQVALRKLSDAETQGVELQRHLDEMEKENKWIKHTAGQKGGSKANVVSPDSDMLRDLVGNQQRTIGNLQKMLRSMAPESGNNKELEDVINKIQRTNNDLNSCVMLLEDENSHLRDRVESLQERVANLESHAVTESASVTEPEPVTTPSTVIDDLANEAPATDMPADASSAQDVTTDADAFDVAAILAESVPAVTPVATDLAGSDDDVDTLLDAAVADAKGKPAVSEPVADAEEDETATHVDLAQDVSADTDDFDVDALLAASTPAAKPVAVDLADYEDDIDALLDAAAADAKAKPAEPEPETDVDPAEVVSADTDDFDVDALLAASAPACKGDEKKPESAPTTAKSPSLTQGEVEQDDIDALLADLFADDNKAGDGSKS